MYNCTKNRQIAQPLCIYSCQLFLWLTVDFTDLCASVYIYTYTPYVAPAYPVDFLWFGAIGAGVGGVAAID